MKMWLSRITTSTAAWSLMPAISAPEKLCSQWQSWMRFSATVLKAPPRLPTTPVWPQWCREIPFPSVRRRVLRTRLEQHARNADTPVRARARQRGHAGVAGGVHARAKREKAANGGRVTVNCGALQLARGGPVAVRVSFLCARRGARLGERGGHAVHAQPATDHVGNGASLVDDARLTAEVAAAVRVPAKAHGDDDGDAAHEEVRRRKWCRWRQRRRRRCRRRCRRLRQAAAARTRRRAVQPHLCWRAPSPMRRRESYGAAPVGSPLSLAATPQLPCLL